MNSRYPHLAALGLIAFAVVACSSSPAKPLDGVAATQGNRTYLTAALQALGLSSTPLQPAYFTGNNSCGGSNDDQGEMRMTAELGMLSATDADQLVTKARNFWKAQGYKIESFTLQAPTMVDNSQTPPAPSKYHLSTVEADAHGYELALNWTDDPLPNAKGNSSLTSSSPCATRVHSPTS